MGKVDVFVTVGTDHHAFDRAVHRADELARRGRSVVVQYGTSRPPEVAEGYDYVPIGRLEELMRTAAVVVTHGGPATIMQARDLGVLPVVVARDPEHHEHVDGHQMRFAARLSGLGTVVDGQADEAFYAAIDRALANPDEFRVATTSARTDEVVATIGDLIDTVVATRRDGAKPARTRRWWRR